MDTPKYYEFIHPTLQALREGGGSLTQQEMVEAVARILHLSEEVMERRHARFAMIRDFDYCLAWAQSSLKQLGYLTQSAQGVWVVTPEGKAIDAGDAPTHVVEGIGWSGEGGTDRSGLYE